MCARTVVGTDVGGVREALDGCGLVVEPRNPEAFAAACLRLLADPIQCRAMGLKARQKALEAFSLRQCNAAYLAVFQHLATENRRRRDQMAAAEADALPQPVGKPALVGIRSTGGDQ